MTEHNMDHMGYLEAVAAADVETLRRKEATYRGSWKRRGGVGTFMILARKWDRLEGMLEQKFYDIFEGIDDNSSGADGTVLAEVRDLRQYLTLVEAELMARRVVAAPAAYKSTLERGDQIDTVALGPIQLRPTAQLRERLGQIRAELSVISDELTRRASPPVSGNASQSNVVINHEGRTTPLEAVAYANYGDFVEPAPRTDSNKHAERLEDGNRSLQGLQPHQYFWVKGPPGNPAPGLWNVNRHVVPRELWEHLPRLDRELNHKEWELTLPEYQGMYRWEEGPSKWTLAREYLEYWGREP